MSHDELARVLGRIEARLDSLDEKLELMREEKNKRQEQTEARFETMDKRLRSLEQTRTWQLGASAVVGALVTVAWKLIGLLNK